MLAASRSCLFGGFAILVALWLLMTRTKAGLNLRVMALARRLEEMRGTLEMQGDDADAALKRAYSINVGEWRLLTRKKPAAA